MVNVTIKGLIEMFSKLPNLGPTSARRLVLHLLRNKEKSMLPLSRAIVELANRVSKCECGNLDTQMPCSICANERRDRSLLCVVEELGDLWAFEKGGIYCGLYHVLGGTLSAIDGIGPENLNLFGIENRINNQGVKEVIIATNATLDGQVTAHYITQLLGKLNIKISRLACGIPVGGEIDYLDEGTLRAALVARQQMDS